MRTWVSERYRLRKRLHCFTAPCCGFVPLLGSCQVAVDQAGCAVEHAHGADHLNIPQRNPETLLNSAFSNLRPGERRLSQHFTQEGTRYDDERGGSGNSTQKRVHAKQHPEKENRPRSIEQKDDCWRCNELAQARQITTGLYGSSTIDTQRVVKGGGQNGRPQAVFKPPSQTGKRRPTHAVQQPANQHGCADDQRQHKKRIETAARQHTVIDLEQVDRGGEQEQVVCDTKSEDHHERSATSAPGRARDRCEVGSKLPDDASQSAHL